MPDAAGQRAAQRILELTQGLSADDLVVCLISGGGSALLSLPAPGLTLEDKQRVNAALLASGAAIDEMNCVRAVTLDISCVCSLTSSNFISQASPRFKSPHMTEVVAN